MPYEADLYFKLDDNDAYIVRGYFYILAENGKAPANWKAKEKELIDGMEKKFRQDFLNNLRVRQEFEVPNRQGICLIGGFYCGRWQKTVYSAYYCRICQATRYGSLESCMVTSLRKANRR